MAFQRGSNNKTLTFREMIDCPEFSKCIIIPSIPKKKNYGLERAREECGSDARRVTLIIF
jgi:hypothetical protein